MSRADREKEIMKIKTYGCYGIYCTNCEYKKHGDECIDIFIKEKIEQLKEQKNE